MKSILGKHFYSLREAAAQTGVSLGLLYRLRREGTLSAVPIQDDGDGRWQYYVTEQNVLGALTAPRPTAPATPPAPAGGKPCSRRSRPNFPRGRRRRSRCLNGAWPNAIRRRARFCANGTE